MKKFIISVLVAVVIMITYVSVGYAAEPIESEYEITVDDVIAITDQMSEMDEDIDVLARLMYAEARGVGSTMEQAAVAWCVLNRVDNQYYGEDTTIIRVATARHQFAYSSHTPVTDEFKKLSKDVVTRWLLEKRGFENVGRVLPDNYLYFAGRNGHNYFRTKYSGGSYWHWDFENPYENF
jgi:hypothetical protein